MAVARPPQVSRGYSRLRSVGSPAFVDAFVGSIQDHALRRDRPASTSRPPFATRTHSAGAILRPTSSSKSARPRSRGNARALSGRPATVGGRHKHRAARYPTLRKRGESIAALLGSERGTTAAVPSLLHPKDELTDGHGRLEGSQLPWLAASASFPDVGGSIDQAHDAGHGPPEAGSLRADVASASFRRPSTLSRVFSTASAPHSSHASHRSQPDPFAITKLAAEADPARLCHDLLHNLIAEIGQTIGLTSGGMEKLLAIPKELNEAIFHTADAPDDDGLVVTTPYFVLAQLHRKRKAQRDAKRAQLQAAIASVKSKNAGLLEDVARRRTEMSQAKALMKQQTLAASKARFHLRSTDQEVETIQAQLGDAQRELSKLQAAIVETKATMASHRGSMQALHQQTETTQRDVDDLQAELRTKTRVMRSMHAVSAAREANDVATSPIHRNGGRTHRSGV